jgi:hypothetical protein
MRCRYSCANKAGKDTEIHRLWGIKDLVQHVLPGSMSPMESDLKEIAVRGAVPYWQAIVTRRQNRSSRPTFACSPVMRQRMERRVSVHVDGVCSKQKRASQHNPAPWHIHKRRSHAVFSTKVPVMLTEKSGFCVTATVMISEPKGIAG